MTRLSHIEVDATGDECRVAMDDLRHDNAFTVPGIDGPYLLRLGMVGGRIAFSVRGTSQVDFHLSMGPFRQVLKDYAQICNALAEAQNRLPPDRIEAIDMARRGIHDEGGRLLQERLGNKAQVDLATARRLFTLICAMQA